MNALIFFLQWTYSCNYWNFFPLIPIQIHYILLFISLHFIIIKLHFDCFKCFFPISYHTSSFTLTIVTLLFPFLPLLITFLSFNFFHSLLSLSHLTFLVATNLLLLSFLSSTATGFTNYAWVFSGNLIFFLRPYFLFLIDCDISISFTLFRSV